LIDRPRDVIHAAWDDPALGESEGDDGTFLPADDPEECQDLAESKQQITQLFSQSLVDLIVPDSIGRHQWGLASVRIRCPECFVPEGFCVGLDSGASVRLFGGIVARGLSGRFGQFVDKYRSGGLHSVP
jgi:hypothetical protein